MNRVVEVKNLQKVYQTMNGTINAISDISFSSTGAEFIAIIGPSGSGKSTLIKIIGDIIEPSAGSVTVNGLSSRQARLQGMFSFVFQNPVLLPWRRVVDNVRLPLEILHREARPPAHLLQLVGLGKCQDLYPKELSGGMQQRVALARALTFNPEVLLMDEPFGSLDELTRNQLNLELLRIWEESGVTIFFITHSIAEAVFLADRVFLLSPRPATLEQVLKVPFTRPRVESLRESSDFQRVVRCLREKLN